jgi:hypothetical protein|tara:strand:+ start:1487 stop:1768 length:282 start_codon:yes stop_codon:yes gene_type:complete
MIKNKKINPLNVFEVRQAKSAPPHFEYVNLPMTYNIEGTIVKWVTNNLKHRFYVGKNVTLDGTNKLTQVLTVGFEETKDMSFFMLACPHLKYK